MGSVNRVILVGRLGGDVEVKFTNSGTAVGNVSIATDETWTDKDGQKQKRTSWHRLVFWQKTAELAAQYLKKGDEAYFEGRIETRTYEKNGEKRYSTEIVVERLVFLGGGKRRDGGGDGGGGSSEPSGGGAEGGGCDASGGDANIPF